MPRIKPDRYTIPKEHIISHGVSPRGAKWERFRDAAGDEVYRYINPDDSYTYHFPGGWSYVHDGKGLAEWRTPEGETYMFYGLSIYRSHPYLGVLVPGEAPRRRTVLPPPHRDVELDIPSTPHGISTRRKTYARPYVQARLRALNFNQDDNPLDTETTAAATAQSSDSPARSLRRKRVQAAILTPPTSPDSPRQLRKRKRVSLWWRGSSSSYFDSWSGTSEDSRSLGSEPEWVGSDSSDEDDEDTSAVARRLSFSLSSGDEAVSDQSRLASHHIEHTPTPTRPRLVPVVEIVTPRKKRKAEDSPRTYGLPTPRSLPPTLARLPSGAATSTRRLGRKTAKPVYVYDEESEDEVVYLGEEDEVAEAEIDRVLSLE